MTTDREPLCPLQLEALVRSLGNAFGDRALAVARRQEELAEGDTARVWAAIVERLGG